MTMLDVAAVFPWLLIAVGAWLGYQLVRQNGRILLRLEAIEKRLASARGRPPQTSRPPDRHPAPDFELPDLAGVRRKLSEFRGKDRAAHLLQPEMRVLHEDGRRPGRAAGRRGGGRAVPIVVTTGDADENRKLVEQFGIRCVVLLQEQMEVAAQYRATERRRDIGSMPKGASPANWPWEPSRCSSWRPHRRLRRPAPSANGIGARPEGEAPPVAGPQPAEP